MLTLTFFRFILTSELNITFRHVTGDAGRI